MLALDFKQLFSPSSTGDQNRAENDTLLQPNSSSLPFRPARSSAYKMLRLPSLPESLHLQFSLLIPVARELSQP